METDSSKEAHQAKVREAGVGVGSAEIYIDPVKERRMMLKFDVRCEDVREWRQNITDAHPSLSPLVCWGSFI